MGLRFIRKPSDTPNVQNSDDTRMIRYAYGGYDGYVQSRGNELNHATSGLDFVVGTGVVSLQGYETEVDAQGWLMTVTNSPTKHYYSVYYEVNLATQTTDIKHKVGTSGYPDIPTSDDLTQTTTGVANLLLYRFEATSGIISNVQKKVKPIPYVTDVVERVEQGEIVAGKALTTNTVEQDSGDDFIASTGFVRTALDNKTEINGHKIKARKLIGSGYASGEKSDLVINFSETVVGSNERLLVEVSVFTGSQPTGNNFIIYFSGDIKAHHNGFVQPIGTVDVPPNTSTIAFWGMEITQANGTSITCKPAVSKSNLYTQGTWTTETYGRLVTVYRYI